MRLGVGVVRGRWTGLFFLLRLAWSASRAHCAYKFITACIYAPAAAPRLRLRDCGSTTAVKVCAAQPCRERRDKLRRAQI